MESSPEFWFLITPAILWPFIQHHEQVSNCAAALQLIQESLKYIVVLMHTHTFKLQLTFGLEILFLWHALVECCSSKSFIMSNKSRIPTCLVLHSHAPQTVPLPDLGSPYFRHKLKYDTADYMCAKTWYALQDFLTVTPPRFSAMWHQLAYHHFNDFPSCCSKLRRHQRKFNWSE